MYIQRRPVSGEQQIFPGIGRLALGGGLPYKNNGSARRTFSELV